MNKEMCLSNEKKHVLLVGSSHTRLAFFYVKKTLDGKAVVSKLPDYAGNTEEMLVSLPDWPLEGKDIVHVYAGHRDLMFDGAGRPVVGPEKFRKNIGIIIDTIFSRSSAKIVFSTIPPVADRFFEWDPRRNERISLYNHIIEETVAEVDIILHNFSEFVLNHHSGMEKYFDGLHFKSKFYREYAADLADFLMKV
jgi:hypothetical protein